MCLCIQKDSGRTATWHFVVQNAGISFAHSIAENFENKLLNFTRRIAMNNKKTAELLREKGKAYFNNPEVSSEERQEGFRMLLEAMNMGDPEAMYTISRLAIDGYVTVSKKDRLEYALGLMCNSANRGFVQARAFLNWYCNSRYKANFSNQTLSSKSGPLVDFDGKPISISCKGLLTPIDAVLEYKDGKKCAYYKCKC